MAVAGRRSLVRRRLQRTRRRPGELGGDAAGRAARRCRAWTFPKASRPDARTMVVVPTMIGSIAGVDAPGRGAGGALPRQSRRAPALRAADRLPRCRCGRSCRGDAALLACRAARDRSAQRALSPDEREAIASSCSTVRACGIRANACGWAASASAASWRRSTPAARRRAAMRFLHVVGDTRSAGQRALRDHAGHRHPAAARRRARARRHPGPSAEPRALRRARAASSRAATASCSRAWASA